MAKSSENLSPRLLHQNKPKPLVRTRLRVALEKPKGTRKAVHFLCGPLSLNLKPPENRRRPPIMVSGKVSIHCFGLDEMVGFYKTVLGLDVISEPQKAGSVTLKNANMYCNHPRFITLYSRGNRHSKKLPKTPKLLTLSLPYLEQEAALDWFDHLEYPYKIEGAGWLGWSRVSINDPEGNTIELVAVGRN